MKGNNVIVNRENIYAQVESGETFLTACSEKHEDVSSSTDIETINDETDQQTNEFQETQESKIISSGTTKMTNDETMAKQLILESEEAQENGAMSVSSEDSAGNTKKLLLYNYRKSKYHRLRHHPSSFVCLSYLNN